MDVRFKECQQSDLFTLQEISYKTYDDTFRHLNTPANMKAYLEHAFNLEQLSKELQDHNSRFYFLYIDGILAGYLKLNEAEAQTDIHDPAALEVERIYLTRDFQGQGLGTLLLDKAIGIANLLEKTYLWLGVWEKNEKAIQFYKKNGFRIVGTHSFFMGEEEQTDFVMRKDLI